MVYAGSVPSLSGGVLSVFFEEFFMFHHVYTRVLISRMLAGAGACLAVAPLAQAQTWDGGGADNNWTTANNWNLNLVPANNGTANVFFAGTTRLTPVLNTPYDINLLAFNLFAGTFTLSGASTLTIRAGGIVNNEGDPQIISVPIVVGASQTWSAAVGPLTFSGSTVNISGPSTELTLHTPLPITINTQLTGAGSVIKTGNSEVVIGTPCSYLGGTDINAGTIRLAAPNVLPDNGIMEVFSGGTLDLNGNSDTIACLAGTTGSTVSLGSATLTLNSSSFSFTFAGTITGAGNIIKNGSYSQNFSGVSTYIGTTTVLGGTLVLSASERLHDSSDLAITSATATVNLLASTETIDQFQITGGNLSGTGTLNANNFDLQGGIISARLGGPGSLTKSNAATNTIFNGTNSTYAGNTNVTAGTLITNAQNVLPDTTVVNVTSPGVLQVTNFPDTVRGIAGNGTINILNTTLTINDAGMLHSFDGVIGDTGATGNLTKSGTGFLLLGGANTYSGTTNIDAGILVLNGAERLADSSDVVVNAGALYINNETIDRCTLNNGELRADVFDPGLLRANLAILNNGFVDASLIGSGIVRKESTGTVTLAGINSPAVIQIDDGILSASSPAALGNTDTRLRLSGGTLRLNAPMVLTQRFEVTDSGSFLECLGDIVITNFSPGSTGQLVKTGPGRLSTTSPDFSLTTLNVLAGDFYVGSGILHQGTGTGTSGNGVYHADGSVTTLSDIFSNSGTLRLDNDARVSAFQVSNFGLVTGTGRIAAPVLNTPSGEVRIGSGDSLHVASAGNFTNNGLVEVIGGSAEFEDPVLNAVSTGLIFARSATLRFDSGLSNAGAMAFSFGTSDVFGDISNAASGSIVLSGFSNVTFAGDVVNNGSIRTSAGAASVFFGGVSGAGSFPGAGTVFLEGDLRPGNSPAVVEFGGNLVFGLFATTHIELGGPASGGPVNPAVSDQLIVGNDAEIDGDLTVTFTDGFSPAGSFVYPILVAGDAGSGGRFGQFFSVNLPPDARGLRVRYTPTRVELVYCQADFNTDGFVNSQDFFDFITNFLSTPPGPGADFNADGFVNSQDFFDFLTVLFAGC